MDTADGTTKSLLWPRERQALVYAVSLDYAGSAMPYVSKAMGITRKTVETHFTRLYERLGVNDIFAAGSVGYERGIFTLEEVLGVQNLPLVQRLVTAVLTPREEDVLKVYAAIAVRDGSVNMVDVASELNRSKKTVETHLTRLYRKVGIHNKAQLATIVRLHQQGIPNSPESAAAQVME